MEVVFITFESRIHARLRNGPDEGNPDGRTLDVVVPLIALHSSPAC
jgi:hypothetical protein